MVEEKDLVGMYSKLKLKGKVAEEAAPSSSALLDHITNANVDNPVKQAQSNWVS